MPFNTIGQEWIFLGCLLAGLLMGAVYEAGFILRFCIAALFKESRLPSADDGADKREANADVPSYGINPPVDADSGKLKARDHKEKKEKDKKRLFIKSIKQRGKETQGTQAKLSSAKQNRRKPIRPQNIPAFTINLIIDLVFFGICFLVIRISSGITADGQIFWYTVAAYILGFIIERISLGIIVAKFINMIYNAFARLMKGLMKTKFFARLFR